MVKKSMIWMMLSMTVLLCGCGAGKDKQEEDYKMIVDDFAREVLLQDQDSALYDETLAAVGQYMENPDADTLTLACQTVQEALEQMDEAVSACVPYEMDEEFEALLQDYGIDPEEYKIHADARSASMSGYISNLETLAVYLENERGDGAVGRVLRFLYEFYGNEQELMRGYGYCSINYWFAGWDDEAVEYVQQQVLSRLQSFAMDESVWEVQRDAVERKMSAYLDQYELLIDDWTKFLGENREDLYELEMESQ